MRFSPDEGYILVVEDDEAIRPLIETILKEETGLPVHTASDGVEALTVIDSAAKTPILAILDVCIPGVNGVALARALRQSRANLPILVISAFDKGRLSRIAKLMGAFGRLQKPFEIEQLLEAIHPALLVAASGPAPLSR